MIAWSLECITCIALILSFVRAQAPWPGAVPFAIRSPYLNSWLPGPGQQQQPIFWNDRNQVLGSVGCIRIDGVTWGWLGPVGTSGNLTNTEITPTRTILTFIAGPMELEVTFLSPIEPTDLVLQSFPFTYIYLTAKATDGANHSVQVYSDISAEWVSGDDGTRVTWNTTLINNLVYHQAQSASPRPMQEINDQAEDATVYYAMANSPNVTWQTGPAVRGQFMGNSTGGRLSNTEDQNPRSISDNWPLFAFSMDLGSVSEISTPVVWALGLVRDPTISYGVIDGGIQPRSSFFWTQYQTIGDAIRAFVQDFPNARQRAIELDQKITSDASSISKDYANLVSLSVRQTMGGIDITTSKGAGGQWRASDIMIFMKSVGDSSRRVNPTEFMFAAFPAYLYLNATWAGFLLRSSLQQQAAAVPTTKFAMPDLGGSSYPSALGNASTANTETLAIESSANMIIMVLAHARSSGDGSLISRYYTLLQSWANYLAANALNSTFTTSDGQNNPNLAIKGIIGIRAMGEISQIVGQAGDASRFENQAFTMLIDWESRAILSNHITSTYGQSASWGLIYNLFSERLLKLDFITQKIYDDQTTCYAAQIPTAGKYGIAYDSNVPDQAKSHWTMLTAATTTDNSTRDDLVSMVRLRAWLNNSTEQFPTDYDAVSGAATGMSGRSSPAQGAMFAFLALNLPQRSIQASGPDHLVAVRGRRSKPNVEAIVGGTLAGVAVIGLAYVCLLLWKRRQKREAPMPAPSLDPFPSYSEPRGAGDTSNYPRRKGDRNSHGQHAKHSAPTPNDPPTHDVLLQRPESGLRQLNPTTLSSSTTPAPPQDSGSPQANETRGLRGEVEILRSEVAELRAQRMYDSHSAPPQYDPAHLVPP